MWQIVFLTFGWDLVLASAYSNFRKSVDSTGRRQYQVQNGPCSYTFLLPETDSCRSSSSPYMSNAVQRDAPLDYDDSVQRLQVLENILENNTQWLMKVGKWAGSGERELTALALSGTGAAEVGCKHPLLCCPGAKQSQSEEPQRGCLKRTPESGQKTP